MNVVFLQHSNIIKIFNIKNQNNCFINCLDFEIIFNINIHKKNN